MGKHYIIACSQTYIKPRKFCEENVIFLTKCWKMFLLGEKEKNLLWDTNNAHFEMDYRPKDKMKTIQSSGKVVTKSS